jgi:4a-hydroxytetrahydrobiopterin dehydratase
MTDLLSEAEIRERLAGLPAWQRTGTQITAEFRAADFRGAIALVNGVADAAEAANHHPDIDIRYDRVLFVLSTHSAGGLTGSDFALASEIDRIAQRNGAAPSSS